MSTAEMIVFPAFLVLLVIMYYKNKSDVRKHRAKLKKNANLSMRRKPNLNIKRAAKKQSFYGKELSKPKPR